MLLRRINRLRQSQDQGSALIAVLGVMIIGLTLSTLIASSVVSAYSFSSSTRAGVQSHAAADAGIAAARSGLYVSGNCASQSTPGTYSSTGSLAYTTTVQFDAGAGWQNGCPTAAASRVRIVSTGAAATPGVSGASASNSAQVETIASWLVPGVKPSGPAVDMYGGGQVEANSGFDIGSNGLVVQNGELDCTKNNSVFNGNLTVNGSLVFTGNCTVNGNVVVSGAMTLGSGTIVGNLTAGSVSPNPPPHSQVTGTYTQSNAVIPMPPWVDVTYSPSSWVDSNGVPYQVLTAPTDIPCSFASGNLGGTTPGAPVIINMLGCVGGPSASNNTSMALTSDVVIFANQFNFSSVNALTFTSSSSALHKLWFITPDNTPNHVPSCNRTPALTDPAHQDDFVTKNSFTASDVLSTTNAIQAMLYTPCALVAKNNLTWNGQIYTGGYTTIVNNPTYTFAQIGIAGYDLTTGSIVPSLTGQQPGGIISNRDLAGG